MLKCRAEIAKMLRCLLLVLARLSDFSLSIPTIHLFPSYFRAPIFI
jgi:hypothetical protein